MDVSGMITAFIPSLLATILGAWLFCTPDTNERAIRRLKLCGNFLYRAGALFGGCAMVTTSGYEFYKFAYSEDPISRLEIIGLFFYMLNFFVYLIATVAVIACWNELKKPRVKQ